MMYRGVIDKRSQRRLLLECAPLAVPTCGRMDGNDRGWWSLNAGIIRERQSRRGVRRLSSKFRRARMAQSLNAETSPTASAARPVPSARHQYDVTPILVLRLPLTPHSPDEEAPPRKCFNRKTSAYCVMLLREIFGSGGVGGVFLIRPR